MKNRYRIVRDTYNGFEAQVLLWYWPFWWCQLKTGGWCLGTNTSPTLEGARVLIELHKVRGGRRPPAKPPVEVVEYID